MSSQGIDTRRFATWHFDVPPISADCSHEDRVKNLTISVRYLWIAPIEPRESQWKNKKESSAFTKERFLLWYQVNLAINFQPTVGWIHKSQVPRISISFSLIFYLTQVTLKKSGISKIILTLSIVSEFLVHKLVIAWHIFIIVHSKYLDRRFHKSKIKSHRGWSSFCLCRFSFLVLARDHSPKYFSFNR